MKKQKKQIWIVFRYSGVYWMTPCEWQLYEGDVPIEQLMQVADEHGYNYYGACEVFA